MISRCCSAATALALLFAVVFIAATHPARAQGEARAFAIAACPAPAASAQARCFARIRSDRFGHPLAVHPAPGAAPPGYSPYDLRSAYKIAAQGSDETIIAVVTAFGYSTAAADLAVYRHGFGLAPCTAASGCFTKYNEFGVKGGYPPDNLGWAEESALDLDMASAMCPGCKLILVEAKDNQIVNLGFAVKTAAALGAHAIINSYGAGESASDQQYDHFYNQPGVAVTAPTGGAGFGTYFPATSPYVVAVGGTSLTRDSSARGWAESAWGSSANGCSIVFPKPPWQSDPLCGMRMVADVAAVADPSTGVAVYAPVSASSSAWLVVGGTSVSAAIIGGVYGANGGPVHYASDPYHHTNQIYDITTGSTGSCGGTYICTAGPGYDGPTGVGTPKGVGAF